jgi:hypothetical protein
MVTFRCFTGQFSTNVETDDARRAHFQWRAKTRNRESLDWLFLWLFFLLVWWFLWGRCPIGGIRWRTFGKLLRNVNKGGLLQRSYFLLYIFLEHLQQEQHILAEVYIHQVHFFPLSCQNIIHDAIFITELRASFHMTAYSLPIKFRLTGAVKFEIIQVYLLLCILTILPILFPDLLKWNHL